MNNKMKLSIIIPLHQINDTISDYLLKAINSINEQKETKTKPKKYIVCPSNIILNVDNFLQKNSLKDVKIIVNTTDSDYQSQINFAVDNIETDYFSVLEFDDEYSQTYVKNVYEYIDAYPDIDVFLSMMIDVNAKDEPVGFSNEIAWSQHFAGDNANAGYLSLDSTKTYSNFRLSGATMKKSSFKKIGSYKKNILLTFMYEFLLRSLYNENKVYVIPKLCYKHLIDRPDSMFDIYGKNMANKERKFWFDKAMSEYYFNNDRNIDLAELNNK
jgi:hypothetical protein